MRGGGPEGVEREVDALTTAQHVVVATAGYNGNRGKIRISRYMQYRYYTKYSE